MGADFFRASVPDEQHNTIAGSNADIQMSFPLQAALARALKALAHLKSFAERIESRSSYKRGLERRGKFEILR